MNFDLFFQVGETISLKNYERDFRIKFNPEAAKNFPEIMCKFFFPDLPGYLSEIISLNKREFANKKDLKVKNIDGII